MKIKQETDDSDDCLPAIFIYLANFELDGQH